MFLVLYLIIYISSRDSQNLKHYAVEIQKSSDDLLKNDIKNHEKRRRNQNLREKDTESAEIRAQSVGLNPRILGLHPRILGS